MKEELNWTSADQASPRTMQWWKASMEGCAKNVLNEHWFMSLQDARNKIEAWRGFYNEERPHSALDWQKPKEFALKNGSKPCLQNNKEPDLLTSEW